MITVPLILDSDAIITFNALLNAAKTGQIPMDQLDSTVLKILRFKEWCLVHERKFVTDRLTEQLMHMDEHIALSKEVADKLVTLLENHKLPLKASENGKKVLVVATTSDSRLAAAKDMANLVT